jgi:branched-chain amino acid transport system permease protein
MLGSVPLFFVLGVVIHRLFYARLVVDRTMMSVLLATAFALSIEGLLGLIWGGAFRSIDVWYARGSYNVLGISLPKDRLIGFALALVAIGLLYALLGHSRYGRALRATIQHRDAAQLLGINTERIEAFGFGISLATAAVGGVIISLITPFFPASHWSWIARLLAIVVLAGLGRIVGAAIVAIAMGVVESATLVSMGPIWAGMLFYLILALTLLIRPHGLFGGQSARQF